ncbi:YezD family protein [Oscillatoria amoena NRMC-F 0135]|nr:YezD family protein [Oscillatoria laete-virens]MDL5048671.1 YezD family protein [Oscillatoria amoena NRMC-F 0135]MDL5053236.1 YezD family protein [Oscillatoria laete-virens NRMC-F 0139]
MSHSEKIQAGTTIHWTEIVQKAVQSLRFGQIILTVHDGKVVQVEKSEKFRLGSSFTDPSTGGTQKT